MTRSFVLWSDLARALEKWIRYSLKLWNPNMRKYSGQFNKMHMFSKNFLTFYQCLSSEVSVQFSRSVVSDSVTQWIAAHQASLSITNFWSSLRLSPSSQWCHPAISSSVVPFSSCPQSLPASESVPMSQLFVWGGQSTGVSASASFLPKNTQD